MSKPLAGDLRMNTAREKVGCVSVTKIMEADAAKAATAGELLPFMREAARLHRFAVRSRRYQRVRRNANANPKQLLGLPRPVCPQFGNDGRRQRHRPGTAALGFLKAQAGAGLLQALGDGELPLIKVEMAPAERQNLAPPEAAQDGEDRRNEHPSAARHL